MASRLCFLLFALFLLFEFDEGAKLELGTASACVVVETAVFKEFDFASTVLRLDDAATTVKRVALPQELHV